LSFITKHKGKIIAFVCIITVLIVAFFCGENNESEFTDDSINDKTAVVSQFQNVEVKLPEKEQVQAADEKTSDLDIYETPQKEDCEYYKENDTGITDNQLNCTLSIQCRNAIGKLNEKSVVIPEDGVIFSERTLVFYEGESVFNVLVREMKKNNIHLEFVNTPIYNSAYIEGISNLYEFDCGELSGWMYKVNGWFPNYGCSRYQLKDGDKIEWVYTCDLGKDVGGDYSARNGMKYE